MAAGRDKHGRFIKGHTISKGNKGGTGRPSRAVEEAYLHTVQTVMPTERWRKCCEAYAVKAERGDRYAFAFFADYLMGKPVEYREQLGEKVFRVIYEAADWEHSAEDAAFASEGGHTASRQAEDSAGGQAERQDNYGGH